MSSACLATPVALIIFNRPELTVRVFEAVRAARPSTLLVVADGARVDHPDDVRRCSATRSVIERVDWPCDVRTNFAPANLGCRARVSSGLDWVFSTVDEAIVLEDDCLPNLAFFAYCEELLARYRDDDRIACVSGNYFGAPTNTVTGSYYFSRYSHIWGWASWSRAWRRYDAQMSRWPAARSEGLLASLFGNDSASITYWTEVFDAVHAGYINTWDYQWLFTCWSEHWLTILPRVNLVSNIGFGAGATHTSAVTRFADLPAVRIQLPLAHPAMIVRDAAADAWTQRAWFSGGKATNRVRTLLSRFGRRWTRLGPRS
jgi:hypothetical protein